MHIIRSLVCAFGLLLAAGSAHADSGKLLTILEQIPAAPEFYGKYRAVDLADLAALRAAAGVPPGTRLADFDNLDEPARQAVTALLKRFYATVEFANFLLSAAEAWPTLVGVDFLALDWVSEPGSPPRRLLFLGGEAAPRGAALEVFLASGLAPVQRFGVPAWAKGEDSRADFKNRNDLFPFWGWLGMSVRLFRSEAALVGARSWADFDLALAVAQGKGESLAALPRFRLAAAAAADPAHSGGPVLQMMFLDEAFGEGVIGQAPRPDGLPPYGLFAFADRQDETGQQVILVLTYEDEASAQEAAALLPAALAAHRDRSDKSFEARFPGLAVTASVLVAAEGAATVLRLATPPEPLLDENGKVANRSRLYAHVLRLLLQRDLACLAPRG